MSAEAGRSSQGIEALTGVPTIQMPLKLYLRMQHRVGLLSGIATGLTYQVADDSVRQRVQKIVEGIETESRMDEGIQILFVAAAEGE